MIKYLKLIIINHNVMVKHMKIKFSNSNMFKLKGKLFSKIQGRMLINLNLKFSKSLIFRNK